MREYQCFEKCYDGSLHRPGDSLTVPEKLFKKVKNEEGEMVLTDEALFIEKHFSLISDDSKPAKPKDPEAAVKAFAKKHKVSAERQAEIFEEAKAVEPHEKLAALAAAFQE